MSLASVHFPLESKTPSPLRKFSKKSSNLVQVVFPNSTFSFLSLSARQGLVREAWTNQNGWNFGKVPKGKGGHWNLSDLVMAVLCKGAGAGEDAENQLWSLNQIKTSFQPAPIIPIHIRPESVLSRKKNNPYTWCCGICPALQEQWYHYSLQVIPDVKLPGFTKNHTWFFENGEGGSKAVWNFS